MRSFLVIAALLANAPIAFSQGDDDDFFVDVPTEGTIVPTGTMDPMGVNATMDPSYADTESPTMPPADTIEMKVEVGEPAEDKPAAEPAAPAADVNEDEDKDEEPVEEEETVEEPKGKKEEETVEEEEPVEETKGKKGEEEVDEADEDEADEEPKKNQDEVPAPDETEPEPAEPDFQLPPGFIYPVPAPAPEKDYGYEVPMPAPLGGARHLRKRV